MKKIFWVLLIPVVIVGWFLAFDKDLRKREKQARKKKKGNDLDKIW